jgi:hypothetical protein
MLVPLTAACLLHVAAYYSEPVEALQTLRRLEAGQVGTVSHNLNGTSDLGPMQVNEIWVPFFAKSWHKTRDETYLLLRDHGCVNALAAGAILRSAIDEAHGDIGIAVGYYNSHTPTIAARYRQHFVTALKRVLSGEE